MFVEHFILDSTKMVIYKDMEVENNIKQNDVEPNKIVRNASSPGS